MKRFLDRITFSTSANKSMIKNVFSNGDVEIVHETGGRNLVDKMVDEYYKSKKEANSKDSETEGLAKLQISVLISKLTEHVKNGEHEIRVVSKNVYPQTIQYFKDEGFIVWHNSEVVVIRLPVEHSH